LGPSSGIKIGKSVPLRSKVVKFIGKWFHKAFWLFRCIL
jgi:hypothetical protein